MNIIRTRMPEQTLLQQPSARFAGLRDGGASTQEKPSVDPGKAARKAEKDEMMAMLGGNLKEGILQRIFRGFVPLNFLSKINVEISPERKAELDAYGELIQIALRDKRFATPESEAAVRAKLENPSPALKAWMDKYNLDADALATPVADYYQVDKDAFMPPEVLLRMRQIGLFGLKVPKEYGGHGLSQKEYDRVVRSLSHTSGVVTAIVSAHSTIGGTLKLGNDEQKAQHYPNFTKGEYMAAFGLTEPNAGTDASSIQTRARLVEENGKKEWELNGEKIFITNTHRSGVLYVFAKTQVGDQKLKPTAFIVELPFRLTDTKEDIDRKRAELAKQGLIISEPLDLLMIRGSNQAHITFKNYRIPYENVLGGEAKIGAGMSEPFNALNAGRAGFGPTYSESANIIYATARQYAREREMFKRMYGGKQKDLPAVRDKLAQMAMKSAALNALSDMVSAYIEEYEKEGYNIIAEAAAIKVASTDTNWDLAVLGADILGGRGTMKKLPSTMEPKPMEMEKAMRDAWIGLIVEGVNDAMKQLAVGTGANRLGQELMKGRLDKLVVNRALKSFRDRGDLSWNDARWLHRRARMLNNRILMLGTKHMLQGNPKGMEKDQRNLLRLYDVAIDIFTLATVMLKLKKNPNLPADEKAALQGYVQLAKQQIDQNLKQLTLRDNATDRVNEAVAKATLD